MHREIRHCTFYYNHSQGRYFVTPFHFAQKIFPLELTRLYTHSSLTSFFQQAFSIFKTISIAWKKKRVIKIRGYKDGVRLKYDTSPLDVDGVALPRMHIIVRVCVCVTKPASSNLLWCAGCIRGHVAEINVCFECPKKWRRRIAGGGGNCTRRYARGYVHAIYVIVGVRDCIMSRVKVIKSHG